MLAIKLQRIGKKHQPSYRLVVAEKRSKLGGPPVEDLGSYNPFTKLVTLQKDRLEYWLKTGAKPTVSVHNLFVREGVISEPKIAVRIRKKKAGEGSDSPEKAAAATTEQTPPEAKSVEPTEQKASTSEQAEQKSEVSETAQSGDDGEANKEDKADSEKQESSQKDMVKPAEEPQEKEEEQKPPAETTPEKEEKK